MKNLLIAVITIAVLVAAGYLAAPLLLENELGPFRTEIQGLQLRLAEVEAFIQKEKAAREVTHLSPDADMQKVISAVNQVSSRLLSLESSLKKDMAASAEEMKNQKLFASDELRKQAESLQKMEVEMKSLTQKILFDASMANIRVHVLKARADLLYKNIGTAKSEFALIAETLEKLKNSTSKENSKIISEYQGILKSIREEVEQDLPSAMNKIDLLWHEMGKLLNKG